MYSLLSLIKCIYAVQTQDIQGTLPHPMTFQKTIMNNEIDENFIYSSAVVDWAL
jgi:hypothetical protein